MCFWFNKPRVCFTQFRDFSISFRNSLQNFSLIFGRLPEGGAREAVDDDVSKFDPILASAQTCNWFQQNHSLFQTNPIKNKLLKRL
jgi:hypothetical protein